MLNRLKSIYISLYMMILMGALGYSIYAFYITGQWAWIGTAMAAVPALYAFATFFLSAGARTAPKLNNIAILIVQGVVASGVLSYIQLQRFEVGLPVLTGLLLLALWLIYDYWYANLGNRKSEKLQTGSTMPDYQLEDIEGQTTTISKYQGKPSLILFFRGNWCPFCMAQIKELVDQYKEFETRGIQVILVSPQKQAHSKSLSDKFGLPFIYLRDKNNEMAKQLDIFQNNGTPLGMEVLGYESDTVMPTVILLDAVGVIRYTDLTENYRVRPEPAEYLKVADEFL